MKRISWLIKAYYHQSPRFRKFQEIDGTFFPREINEPDVPYIPRPEPQVIITDWYDNPDDWYYIPELIQEYANQAYVAYYRGIYFASFMCAVSCLELTLKYELVRRGRETERLNRKNFTFGNVIREIRMLNLEQYESRLSIVNLCRIGFLHFNPEKLHNALQNVKNELIDPDTKIHIYNLDDNSTSTIVSNDDEWLISEYSDNVHSSKIAFYTYSLMYDITKELYGEQNKAQYFQEGIDDYHRRKTNS
jgi:hypothetical protein